MRIVLFVLILSNWILAEQFCIIVDEGAVITQHYRNNIQVNIGDKFGYGFMSGKKKNDLVEIIKDNKTIGWIEKKYIQCSEDIGKIPYIEAIKVKTVDGKDSMLYKKSFITNSVFTDDNSSTLRDIPRYLSPIGRTRMRLSSKLYEIYFVLKEDRNRLLLSKVSTIFSDSYNNNNDSNIIGWVNKKHLKEWDSRVAIEPTIKNLPAYWDIKFNRKYRENVDKPVEHYSLRYPQLGKVPNGIHISYMQKEGAFGYIRDTKSKLGLPHIVFLLDATAGMQNYMENVKGGISDYLKDMEEKIKLKKESKNRLKLKVAVALYRDYSDGDEKYQLITNGFVTPQEAIRSMSGSYFKAKSTNDCTKGCIYNGKRVTEDRARSEALFNGIISVCKDKNLRLDNFASTRIILIGDHGNHLDDDMGYTTSKVAKALGKKAVINAVQVHTSVFYQKYVNSFRRQINEIIRKREVGHLTIDNKGSRKTIKKSIIKSVGEIEVMEIIVRKKEAGNNLTIEEKNLLKRELGIDADKLGEIQQSVELYIKDREKNNYKKVILTENDFVDELASAYTTMARTITRFKSNKQGIKRLRNGLGKAIETLTGQEIQKDDNIAEFLEQRLKIPKSEILNLTFYDWVDDIARNRNDYRAKVIRKFRKSAVLLKALTAEKIYENITFNKQNEIAYKERRDKNGNSIIRKTRFNISVIDKRNFGQDDSPQKKWIWVPFEYMP